MNNFEYRYFTYLLQTINNEKRSLKSFDKDGSVVTLSKSEIESGFITDETYKRIAKMFEQDKKSHDNWLSSRPKFVSAIIAPEIFQKEYFFGEHRRIEDADKILPIVVPVKIDPKNRRILYDSETKSLPYIPREYLEPNNSNQNPILTTVNEADDAYAELRQDYSKWEDVLKNVSALRSKVFHLKKDEKLKLNKYKETEFSYLAFYENKDSTTINIESLIQGVFRNYEDHTSKGYEPYKFPCFSHILETNNSEVSVPSEPFLLPDFEKERANLNHLGQMQSKNSLSPSQRETIAHYLSSNRKNPVFAVDGPPGTGKTTLLLSIIASLWVKHAYEGKLPPIIVGTSANNQAITNILEAFSNAGKGEFERWIPELDSFGLYLTNNDKGGFPFTVYKLNKDMELSFDDRKINAYIPYFINKYISWNTCYDGDDDYSLPNISFTLKWRLNESVNKMQQVLLYASSVQRIVDRATKNTGERYDYMDIKPHIEYNIKLQYEKLLTEKGRLDKHKDKACLWEENKNKTPWWIKALFLVKITKPQSSYDTKFCASIGISKTIDSREGFNRLLALEESNIEIEISKIERLLTLFSEDSQTIENFMNFNFSLSNDDNEIKFIQIISEHKNLSEINNWIDRYYRFENFVLATHYYECEFLIETKNMVLKQEKSTKTRLTYERYAKLFPCFVSTLYSLPPFFKFKEISSRGIPFFRYDTNSIDLLIMDETGQVAPHIGLPATVFAKEVLCVGDVNQIPPIYSTTRTMDIVTASTSGLAEHLNYNNFEKWNPFKNKLLAHNGNMMTLAQNSTEFCKFPQERGWGMFLQEHRRCYNDIINICNELVYKGRLIPLREGQEFSKMKPVIGYAHISSQHQTSGGSKSNKTEATCIAKWIAESKEKILSSYSTTNETKELHEIIAVVTPFASQARLINIALNNAIGRGHNITVGTVHSLQGAEKSIVIFSPTLGRDEIPHQAFYNKVPSIINVAVSRAKDSFLVFGNMNLFRDNGDETLASTILGKHLFKNSENEVKSDIFTKDFLNESYKLNLNEKDVILIDTLDGHMELLKKSFDEAKERVLITSPYVSKYAIKHNNSELLNIMTIAIKRGVKVILVPDRRMVLNSGKKEVDFMECVNLLESTGAKVYSDQEKSSHNKIIAVDNSWCSVGSFNWLSASRELGSTYQNRETTIVTTNSEAQQKVVKAELEACKLLLG